MTDLPVSPTGKRDHEEYLEVCWAWERECDDPGPFDDWAEQIARRMDRNERAAWARQRGGQR